MQVWLSGNVLQTENPTPTPEPLTFDQPVGTLPIVDDARWSSSLTDNSFWALVVWIVLLFVLQAATWPLVKRLFQRFPDRGWGFARILSIALAGFVVWFPTALQLTQFRAIWCWVAVLAIAGTSWFWSARQPAGPEADSTSRHSVIVATETVFWLVFGLFLLFRFMNPDSYEPIWGGEKAMEFAHINSILRSAHFPPVDPWYAGGYLNYYYYGSYLVAFLIKLTGIPTEIAFNLSLPLFMALLGSGMFSLGSAIARTFSRSTLVLITGGAAATIFSVLTGNMVAAARTVESITDNRQRYLWNFWVWGPTRIFPKFVITEFPFFAGLYGDLHAHVIALPFTVLIAALVFSVVLDRGTADDFRPRIIALSLLPRVLLLGLLLGTLFMTNAWDAPVFAILAGLGVLAAVLRHHDLARRALLSGALVAFLAAAAYISIVPFNQYYVALFSEIGRVSDKTPLLPVESHFGGFLIVMTAGFVLVGFREERRGLWLLDPLIVLPVLGFVLGLRWYSVENTPELKNFADYATVVIVGTVWIAVAWIGLSRSNDFALPASLVQGLLALGAVAAIVSLITERPVLALYLAIGAAAGVSWLSSGDRPERFPYALMACGALLGASLEIVFLVDDLNGGDAYRMNTMFKFYNQIWTLFAIASAGCVARMIAELSTPPSPVPPPSTGDVEEADVPRVSAISVVPTHHRLRLGWARAGLVLTTGVVLLGLAYPVQAIGPRLDTRFPHPDAKVTLNAFSWMDYASIELENGDFLTYADDRAAMNWFNEEVSGNPVIAEAAFGTYRCNGSRFSIATGLPAVIGWERHEQQQRDRTLLPERVRDMRELYESEDIDTKNELIDSYGIEYIVVGQTERVYPEVDGSSCVPTDVTAGISVLESMLGTRLEVAFEQGTTTVYRVPR